MKHAPMVIPAALATASALFLSSTFAMAAPTDSPASTETIASSPGKPGKPIVVVSDGVPIQAQPGAQPISPETFSVDGAKVYIPDPVHDNIRAYQSGKYSSAIGVGGVPVIDMIASGTTLTVLDNSNSVHTYSMSRASKALATGSIAVQPLAKRVSAKGALGTGSLEPEVGAARLDKSTGSLRAQMDDGSWVPVGADSSGSARSNVAPGAEQYQLLSNGFNVLDSSGEVAKTITVPHEPISIERLASDGANTYYLVSDGYYREPVGNVYDRYVFKYTNSGELAGVYTLAIAYTYTPSREAVVSGGRVYQLFIDGSRAKVLELTPDTLTTTIKAGPVVDLVTAAETKGAEAAPVAKIAALEKPSTMVRAVRIANLDWKYTKSKNGNTSVIPSASRSKVAQPHYLRSVTSSTTITGYPYTWGGFDSEWDSSSSSWGSFADGLSKSKYTGNVSGAAPGWVSNTIGLDCSGLVSTVYKLGTKYGTGSLLNGTYFKKSTAKPVQGDIYNKSGSHVVIVMDRRYEDGRWIMIVGESTTADSKDKVLHRLRTESSFTGYVTGKYQHWTG